MSTNNNVLTDERIIEIARVHFKPDANDTPETIRAFIACVRDILSAQAVLNSSHEEPTL